MCVHPRVLKLPDAFGKVGYRFVRCGRCVECLKEYQNNWKVRCIVESNNWKFVHFFTLTYAPEHVPKKSVVDNISIPFFVSRLGAVRFSLRKPIHIHNVKTKRDVLTCCKRDVQLWLKRGDMQIRRSRNGEKIKWFGCAEYGPHGTHRPHYHILIWSNANWLELDFLRKDWTTRFGFVKHDVVKCSRQDYSQVAGYISKYCNKGRFEKLPDPASDETFRLFSKGIGISYVDNMRDYHLGTTRFKHRKKVFEGSHVFDQAYIDWILDERYYKDGECKIRLPRYWSDKIYFNRYKHEREDGTIKLGKFHKKNQLQVQITETLLARAANIYHESLRQIQALHPDWEDEQVRTWHYISETFDLAQREKDGYSALARYYLKHDLLHLDKEM